jgi:hypothetical protein
VRYCRQDKEVCCQINNLNEITAGKSSVPESAIKFPGGAGFSPGLIHVQPLNVKPDIIFAGEHGHHSSSSTSKSVRDTSSGPNSVFSSTVDYSDTKFGDDVRFASTFQGPAYLPPIGPTTPKPRPFETPSINQQFVPRPSPPKYVPPSPTTPRPAPPTYRPAPSTTFRPAPSPTYRPAPSTTFRPAPSTSREYLPPRPSTPRPSSTVNQYVPPQKPYQPSVTPQQPYQPSVTPQRPYQPSVTPQKPYQPGVTPQQPYRPSVTPQKPYQPSVTPQQPYQPSVTPQRPYQPSVTPQKPYQPSVTPQKPYQPSVTTQRPYQPSVTTQRPYQPSITPQQPYQPSITPQKPYQPSVTPQRPYQPSVTPQKPYQPSVTPQQPYQPSVTPQRPYQPQQTTPRPYQPSQTPYQPQQPYQPSTSRPTTSREYLPPRPSSPFAPQPSSPRPNPFIPQQTTQRPTYQPQPRPTPSPQYPSPSFPQTPKPQYPSPSVPQPRPTPAPYRPSGPTSPPFRPTPSIPQFPSPSSPQPRPTPGPVTGGYSYPSPSSPRPTPFIPQSTPSRPGSSVTNQYRPSTNYVQPSTPSRPAPTLRPYQPSTQKPYQPSTQRPFVPQQTTGAPNPAGGYEYPKPTPTFGYPSTPSRPPFGTDGSSINSQYVPPPKKPGDNTGEAANNNGAFVRPTTQRTQFTGELNTAPPPGCAAALKCVQEIYCTAEGVISPVPVVLSKEQELSRVPTTVCQDTESGIIGKCCRDPNYQDPWPSANLVNGVDDGRYAEDDSLGQYQPDLQRNVRSDKGGPRQDFSSNRNTNLQPVSQPSCGQRHRDTSPPGPGPLDVNFAEIPWQAMVLRDTNRSLLCGGVIVRRDAVLTAAHCVEGLETGDILIKGGEWKLGIDEEPLPFQIVNVAVVVRHPQYQKGSLVNDLALLILEEKLRPSKNVGTLCLPTPNQIPTENCIATGWGKRILQRKCIGAWSGDVSSRLICSPRQRRHYAFDRR